jgi:hypothetical protein
MNLRFAGFVSGYFKKLQISDPAQFPQPVLNETGPQTGDWTIFFGPLNLVQTGPIVIPIEKLTLKKGFYAFLTNSTGQVTYTNGTITNAIYVENDQIGIYQGYAVGLEYRSNLPTVITDINSPRVVNLEINYEILKDNSALLNSVGILLLLSFILKNKL